MPVLNATWPRVPVAQRWSSRDARAGFCFVWR